MTSTRPAWFLLVPVFGAIALWQAARRPPASADVKIVHMPVPMIVAPAVAPAEAPPHALALRELLPLPPAKRPTRTTTDEMHLRLMSTGWEVAPVGVASAIMAVHANPGDVEVRAAIACGLARLELRDDAKLEIEQLRAVKDCPRCVDAAIAAAECANGAVDTSSPIRNAARAVLAGLHGNDRAKLAPFVTAPVSVTTICSVCDGDVSTTKRWQPAELLDQVQLDASAQDKIYWGGLEQLFCSETCCYGPIGKLNHTTTSIMSLCFAGPRDRLRLAKIDALAG